MIEMFSVKVIYTEYPKTQNKRSNSFFYFFTKFNVNIGTDNVNIAYFTINIIVSKHYLFFNKHYFM